MKMNLNDIITDKNILTEYSFAYEKDGFSKVICKCGARFEKEIAQEERLTDEEAETLADMKELVMFSAHEMLKCPECNTNYFNEDERARLIPMDTHFIGGFSFVEHENSGKLTFWRMKANVSDDGSISFQKEQRHILMMGSDIRYIPFHSDGESVDAINMDLDNIVDIVSEFMNTDPVRTLHDVYGLHLLMIWLTKVTPDAMKMNIVGEIMAPMRNRINNAGLDYFNKALCVFLCINKFPNLSTIALTKSILFLSDLIMNCDIPSSSEMKKKNLTAPLDIFNSLTGSYLKRLKNELQFDNNSVKEYVFSPSQHTPDISIDGKIIQTAKSNELLKGVELPTDAPKLIRIKTDVERSEGDLAVIDSAFSDAKEAPAATTLSIKVRDQVELDKKNKSRLSQSGRGERGGRSEVTSVIEDGSITKYIYDKIRTFSDYTRLIKFFKLYNKNELADLMKKYEIDYLIHFIDVAYWRERMNDEEFYRLSKIIKDFIRLQTKGKKMFTDFNPSEVEVQDDDLDYALMERFDFTIYDDAISMLESLRSLTSEAKKSVSGEVAEDMFDRTRYFDKIREYKKLKNFHDSLAAQYRVMKSQGLEKDSSYNQFVGKYEWLEERSDYDGPISVQLLRSMGDFIEEGHRMMSSQAQYGAKVSRGIYLIAKLIDESPDRPSKDMDRFTIGFTVDRYGHLEFDQLKGYKNAQAPDRVKSLVRKWLSHKGITYDVRTTDIKYRNQDHTEA